jgi:hypothetical protein
MSGQVVQFCPDENRDANVGWLKLFFKMCGEKIFKSLGRLVGRQSQFGSYQVIEKLSAKFWSSVGGCVGRPALAGNGWQLQEVGDFVDENCLPAMNLIRSTKLHVTTEPPISCRCCYQL